MSQFPHPRPSFPHSLTTHDICPLTAMPSAPLQWLAKTNDQASTPRTEAPSSVRLRQSIADSIERDLTKEATARGMTLTAMHRHLLTSPFRTLTRREQCLRDRWLGMQRALPLLLMTRRSPSPTTVVDLSPHIPTHPGRSVVIPSNTTKLRSPSSKGGKRRTSPL